MKFTKNHRSQRHGAISTLVGVLFPIFILLLVFSIDYGVIIVGRQQLQNAADAGAVSTLTALRLNNVIADDAAIATIGNNRIFGRSIGINVDTDIEYGHWDADTGIFEVVPRRNGEAPAVASAGSSFWTKFRRYSR